MMYPIDASATKKHFKLTAEQIEIIKRLDHIFVTPSVLTCL